MAKAKRDGSVAHVIEHLPSKHKTPELKKKKISKEKFHKNI
jgi:hypothetical protein